MAARRMLSAMVGRDEKLSALSLPALCLYLMTIPHLDRDGLIDGRPPVLVGMVAPLRGEFYDDAHGLIMEWVTVGVVTRYNGEREPVLAFHGFRRHQQGMLYDREAVSVYPPPPGYARCPRHGLVWEEEIEEHDGCAPRSTTRAGRSRGQDVVMTTSRRGHAETERQTETEDQDQDQDQVEDGGGGGSRSIRTTSGWLKKQLGYANFSPSVERLDEKQMRSLIVEVWGDWGVQGWLNVTATLNRLGADDLRRLLAWLYYVRQMADDQRAAIRNMPGWITHKIDSGDWPGLSDTQLGQLEQDLRLMGALKGPQRQEMAGYDDEE